MTDNTEEPGSSWSAHIEALHRSEVPPRLEQLHRIADATRRIVHGMVSSDAGEDALRDAADRLDVVAGMFDPSVRRSMRRGFAEASTSGDLHGFFDHSPMLGRANPLAPPVTLRIVDDRTVEGTGTFHAGYEGPPGCVHGGYVAAAFDEVLGAAQSLSGRPGMTGHLSVSYRSPTPLHDELRIRGTFDRIDGRKIFTTGTLHVGDRLCAEAEGLFITVDFQRLVELRAIEERRAAQAAHHDPSS